VSIRVAVWRAVVLMCAGGTHLVVAQERLQLPRYSLDPPAGWLSQVEDERWKLYPVGGENEHGMVPGTV